jgi:alpha-methylacyl-CoA racemase
MIRPLQDLKVVEFQAIGPAPVAGYFLSQFGADVTLVVRPTDIEVVATVAKTRSNPLDVAKSPIVLDIKSDPEHRRRALDLIRDADILIEGLRPGVMERLGLGPSTCAHVNPRLVYGRMTGWGQSGPLAQAPGHDLNYVALTGLLSLSARPGERPIIPPTVLGDAVGGLGMAFGVVAACLEARRTGTGAIVDAAILDITASVGVLAQWLSAMGQLSEGKPQIAHDSPFYDLFECACGGFVSVCAVETEFFATLLEKLGIHDFSLRQQFDTETWPTLKARIVEIFRTRTRSEWCDLLEGSDACFAPVLTMAEAPHHPHIRSRGIFTEFEPGKFLARAAPKVLPITEEAS